MCAQNCLVTTLFRKVHRNREKQLLSALPALAAERSNVLVHFPKKFYVYIHICQIGVMSWCYGVDKFLEDLKFMLGFYPYPRQTDRYIARQIDRQIDIQIEDLKFMLGFYPYPRQIDRQIDRQIVIYIDRQIGRYQIDRQIEK